MTLKTAIRWLLRAGAALVLAALVPDLDVWNVPKYKAELAACEIEAAEMEVDVRALNHRIAVKDLLVKQLIDGRTDFAKVTDQFTALNTSAPEVIDHLRDHYGVEDARRLSALNVLAFAETYLEAEPLRGRKVRVMQKLDAEYDALFAEQNDY